MRTRMMAEMTQVEVKEAIDNTFVALFCFKNLSFGTAMPVASNSAIPEPERQLYILTMSIY